MPVLGQPTVKPYWHTPTNRVRLYQGDCIKTLERLPPASIDLVFGDPPFNIGLVYDVYEDNLDYGSYLNWTGYWLKAVDRVLKPTASVYVAIAPRWQAEIKQLMGQAGWHWRDTLVWHYSFGPRQTRKWTPAWVAIHYFTKHPKQWTWNLDAVKVPSARQLKYGDRRAVQGGKVPDNVWVLMPNDPAHNGVHCGLGHSNVIIASRVAGTFKERTGHPCQMPLPVLERVVLASSNPNDVVLDPFLGSGTTLAAAVKHGRRGVGIELSESYLRDICVPRISSALSDGG